MIWLMKGRLNYVSYVSDPAGIVSMGRLVAGKGYQRIDQ